MPRAEKSTHAKPRATRKTASAPKLAAKATAKPTAAVAKTTVVKTTRAKTPEAKAPEAKAVEAKAAGAKTVAVKKAAQKPARQKPEKQAAAHTKVTQAASLKGAAVGAPKSPAETQRIMARLFKQHPNAFTELDFRTPFELLVATILSAQSTDRGVNQVTPGLFAKYPDAAALANADVPELERILKPTGFYRQKAKAVMSMSAALVRDHGGEVPADMEALTKLTGVGRKTANVVLGHALGVPGMPVDRHVLRVANRIGIAHGASPEEVETQLCTAMPREQWTLTSDTLILHGRRICRPHPLCDQCFVVDLCDFASAWGRTAAPPAEALADEPK